MGDFKKKKDTSERILRRQIERSAAAYTDSKIEELKKYLSRSENDESPEDDELFLIDDDPEAGSGDGSGSRPVFPPDNPTNWILPPLPSRDITPVGTVDSILFQNSAGQFEYNENSSYGYSYLSADGSLSSSLTVKIEGQGEIEDFEVQVTKVD